MQSGGSRGHLEGVIIFTFYHGICQEGVWGINTLTSFSSALQSLLVPIFGHPSQKIQAMVASCYSANKEPSGLRIWCIQHSYYFIIILQIIFLFRSMTMTFHCHVYLLHQPQMPQICFLTMTRNMRWIWIIQPMPSIHSIAIDKVEN